MNKKILVNLTVCLSLCFTVEIAHAQQPIKKPLIEKTPILKPPSTAREECQSFNPMSTVVVNKGGNWVIVDKSKPTLIIASFGVNQKPDADRTLDIIKKYGMNRICFVKPGVPFQYGLVSGKPPAGTYPGEACRSFNPNTVVVSNIQGRWKIVEGSNVIFDFGTNESQARLVLSVIKKHGFTRSCSVGRPVGFHYMAKQTQTVSPIKPAPSPVPPKPPAPAPPPKVVQEIKPPMKPVDIKTYSATTGVTITSPAKGSTWYTRSNLIIQWKETASPSIFHIYLKTPEMDDTRALREIISFTRMQPDQKGMFNYTWRIPSDIEKGDYVVQVFDANQPGVSARSGVFKIMPELPPEATARIADKRIKITITPKSIGTISVTSPVRNATYIRGADTLPITWKTEGKQSSEVKICLYSEGQSRLADAGQCIEVVRSTPNDGRFDWPIPANSRTGKFQVRVQTIDNWVKGDSEGFSIQRSGQEGQTVTATAPIAPTPGPFSITVTRPSEGEKWNYGGTYTVKWKPTGLMTGSARIIAYYPGTESQCGNDNFKYKTWEELGRTDVYAGSYTVFVYDTANYYRGPAKIRVMIESGLTFGDSGTIQIGDPKITVTGPSKGETWVPVKSYTVRWDISGGPFWVPNYGDTVRNVNIRLIPIGQTSPSNQVLLAKEVSTGVHHPGTTVDKYSGTYTGILANVPPGDYKVRVERAVNPLFYADSQPIKVTSTMHPDTIVIGSEAKGNPVDLALLDVFFDGIEVGHLAAKVKSIGWEFNGPVKFKYHFTTKTEKTLWNDIVEVKGEEWVQVQINPNETKTIPFLYWDGFSSSNNPRHLFVPRSEPLRGGLTISPGWEWSADWSEINPTNNTIQSKMICKTPKPDIGTMGDVRLDFDRDRYPSPNHVYVVKGGYTYEVDGSSITWDHPGGYSARVQLDVFVYNWGCSERQFNIKVHVDGGPGVYLGGMYLGPGEGKLLSLPTSITFPGRYGLHHVVFVFDPDEAQNEPYPNAYRNNFVDGYINIKGSWR